LLEELECVHDDEVRLNAVLGSLWFLPPHRPFGTERRLFYLDHANDRIVMTAIDGLAHLEATEAHDRVLAHLAHSSQYVVGAVLRYRRPLFPEEARPILYKALTDRRFIARECAVDELDELGDAEAAPLVRGLVNDPHPHVRQAARWYFESLAYMAEANEEG
jgi:HEAT repeat protein